MLMLKINQYLVLSILDLKQDLSHAKDDNSKVEVLSHINKWLVH